MRCKWCKRKIVNLGSYWITWESERVARMPMTIYGPPWYWCHLPGYEGPHRLHEPWEPLVEFATEAMDVC